MVLVEGGIIITDASSQESSSSEQTKALDQRTLQREVQFEECKTPNPS
jgi:hypothetical protein